MQKTQFNIKYQNQLLATNQCCLQKKDFVTPLLLFYLWRKKLMTSVTVKLLDQFLVSKTTALTRRNH